MKPVSQSTYLTAAEAHWVKTESIRQLMAQAVDIQGLSFAVMTAMAAMLYGHTPTPALVVWYAVSALLAVLFVLFLKKIGTRTDPMLLKRILGNLISNAIKYTQTGGILLACRNTRHGISFEVWDTGVGIAPEQQLVFREFYKGPTHACTSDGFGLGLAIVTQLSGLLGCELTMKSRLGRGTVVSLQFDAPASARPSSTNLAISHQV